jgi:hypothetical protein
MGIRMKLVLRSLAFAGLAASLAACVYYPHGPYGPGYGPPPPANYGPPPPPGGNYGPPPDDEYGPPPGQQPPPGYGQQGANHPPHALTPEQVQKMNDPNWCAQYPHRCKKLQAEYAAQQQGGPPPGNQYGPPPQGQYQGPPPGQQ